MLNWMLAIASLFLWVGPASYYFKDDIRRIWGGLRRRARERAARRG